MSDMRTRTSLRLAALALWWRLWPALALGQARNPYIEPASRLYQGLEFQEALRTIEKGLRWPSNTPEEEIRAAILEGLITAQLGHAERALGAFKRALAMDPA